MSLFRPLIKKIINNLKHKLIYKFKQNKIIYKNNNYNKYNCEFNK